MIHSNTVFYTVQKSCSNYLCFLKQFFLEFVKESWNILWCESLCLNKTEQSEKYVSNFLVTKRIILNNIF